MDQSAEGRCSKTPDYCSQQPTPLLGCEGELRLGRVQGSSPTERGGGSCLTTFAAPPNWQGPCLLPLNGHRRRLDLRHQWGQTSTKGRRRHSIERTQSWRGTTLSSLLPTLMVWAASRWTGSVRPWH